MSTGWYKKSQTNRLWRQQAKQVNRGRQKEITMAGTDGYDNATGDSVPIQSVQTGHNIHETRQNPAKRPVARNHGQNADDGTESAVTHYNRPSKYSPRPFSPNWKTVHKAGGDVGTGGGGKMSTSPYMSDDSYEDDDYPDDYTDDYADGGSDYVEDNVHPMKSAKQDDNIHNHPLMLFIAEFNEVSADIQNGGEFYADVIDDLIGYADETLDELNEDNEAVALEECMDYLQELHLMFYEGGDFEKQYVAWFHALNSLKQVQKVARYVAAIESPDEMMHLDADLLPEDAAGQTNGAVNVADVVDDYYGIHDPSPYDASNAYTYHENPYGDYDDMAQPMPASSIRSKQYATQDEREREEAFLERDEAYVITHDYSMQELSNVYQLVYDRIVENGGWIEISSLYGVISDDEIDALIEEGLIDQNHNRIGLTNKGLNGPEWV